MPLNTAFLLMAQYGGRAVVPLEEVRVDYFGHLSPTKLRAKLDAGEIKLPVIWIERSQKSVRGVHITDLATYLDERRKEAHDTYRKLNGSPFRA